jgi:hypothetical protein
MSNKETGAISASAEADNHGERFDKFGIFDGYASRILPVILGKLDQGKATDAEIEDACQFAFAITRIALDLRDDFWVGIYPSPMQ